MRKLKAIFLVIIMIVLNVFQSTNIVFANTKQTNNNFLDSVTITHEDGSTSSSYKIYETIRVDYTWSLKEHKKGDEINFKLPKELELINNIDLELKTSEGIIVGNVKALKDGNVTVYLNDPNDYIKNHTNIEGNIFFEIRFNRNYVETGKDNVIDFKLNHKISVYIENEELPSEQEILDKWGEINKEDGYIDWTIRVNYAAKKIDNMILTESLGAGQSLVHGSVKISEVVFDYTTGEATTETDVTENFKINERNDGFSIEFNNVDKKGYYVRFRAEITDDSLTEYENTVGVKGNNNNINDEITVIEKIQSGGGTVGGTTGKVSVGVTKKWVGPEKDSVVVDLLANGKETGKSITLNKENGWQYTFANLDKSENGKEIIYSVKEKSIDGYKSEVTGDMTNGFVIKNTNIETVSIPVTKKWIGKPLDSVTIKLLADGVEKQEIKLDAKNNWKYTFDKLLKYDQKDGHEINYTIKENPIEGYNSTITGDMVNGFVVTNTITGKVSVGVIKKWVGPEKDSVVVDLLANGKETGKSITLNKENGWQYTFANLDKSENGKEIIYSVKEKSIDGYKSEVTGDMTNGFVIKNTNIETVSIPVIKKWIGKPLDRVTIKLLADGVEKQEIKLDAKNNWKYTFDKLLKYDQKDGHEINYTIKENPIEGYNSTITGDMVNGFVVTNTITGKVSVGVIKKWVGPEKDSVVVDLLANGKETGKSITLNKENGWQYTFANLDKYENGKEIIYSVKEKSIDGYKSEVTGDMTNGFVIKNTNIETVSIPVIKKWIGKPLDSVTIKLLADGVEKQEIKLDAKNNWKYTFDKLLKYDQKDGHEINYTIKENPIEGYNNTITGDMVNGFIVTNTITGKVSVGVTKKWVGPEKDSVVVDLLANGKETGKSITLNKENGWQYTFANLDKYENGKEIIYSVKEKSIDGYKSEVTGDMTNGFVIKNTNIETVSIPVIKKWIGKPLDSVTIKLLADGVEKQEIKLDAKNNWKYTFDKLLKYDQKDGHEINYTIKENPIEGYNNTITGDMVNGFIVTNTITGKVSVGVTKKWVGPEKDSVVVDLLANGKETGKSITLNKENGWQYTFANLDKYENGKEIIYSVKEKSIDGYKSEVTGDMTNGFVIKNTNIETVSIPVIKKWIGKPLDSVTIKLLADGVEKQEIKLDAKNNWKYTFDKLLKYDQKDGHEINYTIKENPIEGYNNTITGDMVNGFIVTNTITGKVSVGVTKKWVGPEKDSVVVDLLANGKETGKSITLNKENGWQYTFANLDKYENGKEIIYSVKEKSIDGYKSEVTGDMTNGFVIKNTNIETVSIPVIKKWIGKPLDSVTIKLLADGVEKQEIKLDAKNNWKYTFDKLLKYDQKDGHEINYTIKENPIEGYNNTITGDMVNGFVVTNTITGKVSVGDNLENSKSEEKKEVKIDNSPKTGDVSTLPYVSVSVGLFSLVSIILLNKKK